MKTDRKGSKLSFQTETIRPLDNSALRGVAGGMMSGTLQSQRPETCMCSTECLGTCHTDVGHCPD
jgi:hypothetical protein